MILVTGANGQLGKLVSAAILRRNAASRVTLGTRDPSQLAEAARQGFQVAPVDFDAPEGLRNAFAGKQTVLIISTGTLDSATRIRQHRAAVDAAKQAAVKHILYTSFVNAVPESHFPAAAVHADTEAYIKASGIGYTLFRVNQYFENLDGSLAQAKVSGTLALPGAHSKVAYIARRDVADAIVGRLIGKDRTDGKGAENKTYTLTGSAALDLTDMAAALSVVAHKPVQALDVVPDAFAGQLRSAGLPEAVIRQFVGMCAATAAGEYSVVSSDAAQLAGHARVTASTYMAKFA